MCYMWGEGEGEYRRQKRFQTNITFQCEREGRRKKVRVR